MVGLTIRPAAKTPEQPAHPHLAGDRVHRDLGEVRPERVPGQCASARATSSVGVDRDLEAARRARRPPSAPRSSPAPPCPPPRPTTRCPSSRRRGRPAAESLSPIRIPTRSGGTPSASAATWASTVRAPVPMSVALISTRNRPSRSIRAAGRGRPAAGRVRRRGHPGADQPAPVAAGRRDAGRGRPSRTGRRPSRRQATRLRLENGWPLSGSTAGSLRTRSSIGSSPHATASSSIADSSAYMPGASPGARIQDGVGTSSRRELVRGAPGGRRVHHPGADRGLLDELPYGRGLLDRLVADRPEPAVRAGAEPDPLDRRGAVADHAELVLPGQRDPHRPADDPGGHRGEHDVGPGRALGPEAAADVRADHLDPVLGQPEQRGQGLRDTGRALVGVVHEQPVALPLGGARVRLHRVVVRRRGLVRDVDGDRARGQLGVDVALLGVRLVAGVDLLRGVEVVPVGPQLGVVRLLLDVHRRPGGRLPGRLQAVGDHGRDELAVVGDPVALEDQQLVVGDLGAGAARCRARARPARPASRAPRRCRRSAPGRGRPAACTGQRTRRPAPGTRPRSARRR